MRKLPAVEEARAIMTEGMEWSVWRWLLEKRTVREIADRATAALDEADQKVKNTWCDELKVAYNALIDQDAKPKGRRSQNAGQADCGSANPEISLAAKRVKDADDHAERARLDAEDAFDEAERQLNAGLAREAARKALETYDLREAAIRKSQAAARLR